MHPQVFAQSHPDKPAYIMATSGEIVTYRQLDERSNQLAHFFRGRGLKTGDVIALFMENNTRFLEICWAAQKTGLYYAAISSKLSVSEAGYIIKDCEAKCLFTSAAMGAITQDLLAFADGVSARISVGHIPGYTELQTIMSGLPSTPIADESQGRDMLYSSGTTGKPKGVKLALSGQPPGSLSGSTETVAALYGFGEDTVFLSPAPLYHASPLRYSMTVIAQGGTVIVMDSFDTEEALRLIETYRVTHSQWVPTHFIRLLKGDRELRDKYDLSSHRMAIHGAAPCPIAVKQEMIEWWGPILHEYYGGTESIGLTALDSAQWLSHPGSVGRAVLGQLHIVREDGTEASPGEQGTVYFSGGPPFAYHNDPEKTAAARHEKGWFTLGDVGRVDEDGYLYLTDRKAFMIISGGVNIYPQETENILISHPKVADCAVLGVPHDELGEAVKAVVQPLDWTDATPEFADELIAFCRSRISRIKCPRSVDFMAELPRLPTGKLHKRVLLDQYWKK